MNKLYCAILLALPSIALGDTLLFCSKTPTNYTTSLGPTGYTAELNSATAITSGQCGAPPPTGCTTPPVIKSATIGVANYTRWTGLVNVNYYGAGSHVSNIANFQSMYRTDFSVAETPFPGKASLSAAVSLPVGANGSNYIAEQINIPLGYVEGQTPRYGTFSLNQSSSNVPIGYTISRACGDFSNPATNPNSTVLPGCWRNKQGTSGPLQWRKDTTCVIADGESYYLNIIVADISTATPNNSNPLPTTKNTNCGAASCAVAVNNNLGPVSP